MSSIYTECSSDELPNRMKIITSKKRKRDKNEHVLKVTSSKRNNIFRTAKNIHIWNRDDIFRFHACAAILYNQQSLAERHCFLKRNDLNWHYFISHNFIEHKSIAQIETKVKVTKDLDSVLYSFWEKHNDIIESSITSLFHTVKYLMEKHIVKEYENKLECPSLQKINNYLFTYKNNQALSLFSCNNNNNSNQVMEIEELGEISSPPEEYQTLKIEMTEGLLKSFEDIHGSNDEQICISYESLAKYFIQKITIDGEGTENLVNETNDENNNVYK